MAGLFNGLGSVHRNGFAAIDSATGQILPWNPAQSGFVGVKRMFARGDSLFILGYTSLESDCIVNNYSAALQIYSRSTGNLLYSMGTLDDITVDSSYAYISASHAIRRYHLPEMAEDPSWGTNWSGAGGDHTPTWLIVRGDSVYEIGDNRFNSPCTNLIDRQGYFITYDKATGSYHSFYTYEDSDPIYDVVAFERGLLLGNKLFVQGSFSSLNGQQRPDLACIDVTTGALTSWTPVYPNYTGASLPFNRTSPLRLFGNRIWFGSQTNNGVQSSNCLWKIRRSRSFCARRLLDRCDEWRTNRGQTLARL